MVFRGWIVLSMLLLLSSITVMSICIVNAMLIDQVWGIGLIFGVIGILLAEECLRLGKG